MSATLKKINNKLKETIVDTDKLNDKVKDIPKSFNVWDIVVGGVITNLIQKITSFGLSAVRTGLNFNREMQNYTSNFKVMLGSLELAEAKVKELQQFASVTPFGMQDLADATKTLLSFGIEGEYTTGVLKMLGDVALGDRNKFASLSLVFGQIVSTGKLMGQDLLQLINAGFNPLNIISQKTGKSMGELKEEMSKGAISAGMVVEAFRDATAEGGLFFNGMKEGSKTFAGVYSTMMDNISSTLGTLFEPLSNALFSGMNFVIYALNFIKPIIAGFTNFLNDNAESIKLILSVLGIFAIGTAVKMASAWVMAHLPIVLTVAGIVTGIYLLIKVLTYLGITTDSVLGFIAGVFNATFSIIINILLGFGEFVASIINFIGNIFASFANFLANVFKNPISAVIKLFEGLANSVLGILKGIAGAIDFIFGSNLANAIGKWQTNITNASDKLIKKFAPNENYQEKLERVNLGLADYGITNYRRNVKESYNSGYNFGSNLIDNIGNKFKGNGLDLGIKTDNINDLIKSLNDKQGVNNGIGKDIKDKLSGKGKLKSVGETTIKDDNLKYLKDIAERKYQKEYQQSKPTQQVTLNVTTGDINSGADENRLTNNIVKSLIEALDNNLVGA